MFFNFLIFPDILTILKNYLSNFEIRLFNQGLSLLLLIILTKMLQAVDTGFRIQVMYTYRD